MAQAEESVSLSPRESAVIAVAAVEGVAPVSLRTLALYFLKLGATGFGGPIALAGHMQQALVVNDAGSARKTT